jgi:hypothetical protein
MKKIIIFFLFLHFAGCDLFSTRDAQQPQQSRSNYQLATTPDILIQNLINSFSDRNTQNYLACICDSSFSGMDFQFIPSAEAMSKFPVFRQNWGKREEEQYFENLLIIVPSDQTMTLVLSNVSTNPLGDSLIYSADYLLTVPDMIGTYQGQLKFKVIRDSRLVWSIYYWQDIKSTSNSSWSDLKGLYY